VGFNKPHVSVGSEFSNKLNVRLTRKVLDNEGGRVTIGVLIGHVSLHDADAIVNVQAVDIPLEKDEQFVIKVSRLDAIMVQENAMESKQSPIVSSESHCVGVQVSMDAASYSNASIDEALSLNEWLLKFLQ
jgi:hypothetical protein